MLPSIQAKIDKANAYNAKLLKSGKRNPQHAITASGSFDSNFKNKEEKQNWLEKREQAKWESVSF